MCVTFVTHFFLGGTNNMKKKATNEEISKKIGEMANQVRDEIDYEFRVAYSQMCLAENDLYESLDEEQRKLYEIYREKRETFYDKANVKYQIIKDN